MDALCNILVELVACENVVVVLFSLVARSCILRTVDEQYVYVVEAGHYEDTCDGREVSVQGPFLRVPRRHMSLVSCVKSSLPSVVSTVVPWASLRISRV